jgi:sugar/nucleoside kinase (ribokinase family)
MSLTVVGGISVDTITRDAVEFGPMLGGSALYASLAASLFTDVRAVALVGEDVADDVLEVLRRREIDVAAIEVTPNQTTTWRGSYTGGGDARRTTHIDLGVLVDHVPRLSDAACSSDAALLSSTSPAVQLAIRDRLPQSILLGGDTIDHWIVDRPASVRSLLASVDIAFIGRNELDLLRAAVNPKDAGEPLLLGRRATVIKEGMNGAEVRAYDYSKHIPAYSPTLVIDPTGAGDAFAGCLMAYVSAHGVDMERIAEAALLASALASFVVERPGIEALVDLDTRQVWQRVRLLGTLSRQGVTS